MKIPFWGRRSSRLGDSRERLEPTGEETVAWSEVARAVESLAEVARLAEEARGTGASGLPSDALARIRALWAPPVSAGGAPNASLATASMSNEMGRWQSPHDPRFRPYTPLSTDALRTLARTYDILAACVHHLKSEVVKVPLLIVPRDGCANTPEEQDAVARATAFFGMGGGLGGHGMRRAAFEGQLLDDLLILGACAVHFEFETRGDWLDGVPSRCRAIDAATIRPLVGTNGFSPPDEESCYEQWVNGVVAGRFTRHELWYEGLPTLARTDSPYHLSLVEMAAMTTYTALKSDEWNRAWLTDGNGRGKYIKLNDSVTPDQAAQWLEIIDLVTSGNARERHKLGAVPGDIVGSDSRKDADFQAFEHWLATRVMSVMGVNPASIGFNGGQYEANQEAAMGATREGTVAQLLEWRSAFYDEVLARLGFPFLEVVIDAPAKPETPSARVERQGHEITSGLKTLNEVRRENGMGAIEGGDVTLLGGNVKPLAQVIGEQKRNASQTASLPHKENETARVEDVPSVAGKLEAELGRWERKCLNRLARGQSVACGFESEVVPLEIAQEVLDRLDAFEAPTRENVRQLFEEVARWDGQPRAGGRFSFGKMHTADDGGANIGGGSPSLQFREDPADLEGSGCRYGTWRGTVDEFVGEFVDASVENMAVYDSRGKQLCHIIGKGAEVSYPLSQADVARDGVNIHNHPDTPPLAFSDGDFLFCKEFNLKAMQVVTKVMGQTVLLRAERIGYSWNLPKDDEFKQKYAQAYELIRKYYPPSPLLAKHNEELEAAYQNNRDDALKRELAKRCTFTESLDVNRLLEEGFGSFKISIEYL